MKQFINKYNTSVDDTYTANDSKPKLKTRLSVFGGLTNNPFVNNPDNENSLFFGTELEIVQDKAQPKHAGFVNLRYIAENDNLQYSATQLALGYRFRFVNQDNFNVYAQTKFATLTNVNATYIVENPENPGNLIENEVSNTEFDAPLIFGLGADFKVGNGYITLIFDSLFAAFIDNEDNFPMDAYLYYYTGGYDKFQSRNFGDKSPSWQLELKAASAAGGRSGGGSVITILNSLGVSYNGLTSGWENTSFHQACDPKNKTKRFNRLNGI